MTDFAATHRRSLERPHDFWAEAAEAIDWTKTWQLREIVFKNCQLNYCNFKLLKIPGIKMTGCEVKDADFSEADLTNGDFKNTDFEKSRFIKTDWHAPQKGVQL